MINSYRFSFFIVFLFIEVGLIHIACTTNDKARIVQEIDTTFQLISNGNFFDAKAKLKKLIDGGISDPIVYNNYASILAYYDQSDTMLTEVIKLLNTAISISENTIIPNITAHVLTVDYSINFVPFHMNLFLHAETKILDEIEPWDFDKRPHVLLLKEAPLITTIERSWGKHKRYEDHYLLRLEIENNLNKVKLLMDNNDRTQ